MSAVTVSGSGLSSGQSLASMLPEKSMTNMRLSLPNSWLRSVVGTFSGESRAQIAAAMSNQAGILARWNHDGLSPLTFFKDGRVSLATDVAYVLVKIL